MLIDAIRNWQLSQLEKNIATIKHTVQDVSETALKSYRDQGTGWTALEVLCHLRDFEKLFLERIHLTVNRDNPPLPFPDPNALADELNYNADNPSLVFSHWSALRREQLEFLQKRAESDWERPAQHPTRGHFTLHDQLFLTAWHDANHIEQITRILYEKQVPQEL
ncbi:MAG: DinB family protein [Anaerolineae bacterium]